MHDIVELETAGLPGVFVASSVFVEAAVAQQRSLGSSVAAVFVEHPIQDRTDDEMITLAGLAVTKLVSAITVQPN